MDTQAGKEAPYERLLGDAMIGNGALFTREDTVEAAWMVVDRVLEDPPSGAPLPAGHMGPQRG